MKRIVMLIFCLFLGGTAAAKRPVRDFCTMYFSDRTNWYKDLRTDFMYLKRTDYDVTSVSGGLEYPENSAVPQGLKERRMPQSAA